MEAWKEFVSGKRSKKDVQEFQLDLMSNILSLHTDLVNFTYRHGGYHAFNISDPKSRNIHKASVSDRLLHHAVYRILYHYFDKKFVHDSYSCRLNKGTHKAMKQFRKHFWKTSRNNTKTCWVLKCDVRKFFASVDQTILLNILRKYIQEEETIRLLKTIIESFYSTKVCKGLPLGNLTSQLLVNIYMNEFDQFIKHVLKVKYYIRYADDFVVLSEDKIYLSSIYKFVTEFLPRELQLELHPDKVFIKTLASGVDFLGWVHFPDHCVLRTTTKRRMFKNLSLNSSEESRASYLGMLKHGNAYKLREKLKN